MVTIPFDIYLLSKYNDNTYTYTTLNCKRAVLGRREPNMEASKVKSSLGKDRPILRVEMMT